MRIPGTAMSYCDLRERSAPRHPIVTKTSFTIEAKVTDSGQGAHSFHLWGLRMTTSILSRRLLVSTSIFAITAALLTMPTAPAVADTYMSGDFHNHTTCTDGTVSIETMITKSIQTFGLEWMASADHGGSGVRDCRFDDPEGNGSISGSGKFWEETVTVAGLKGRCRHLQRPAREVALAKHRGVRFPRSGSHVGPTSESSDLCWP